MSDMSKTTETLALPAALSIRQANATLDTLRAAFDTPGAIVIDIPEDAEADLSFIQLIEASRRHADNLGRRLTLNRPAAGSVLSTLQRAGFLTDMTPQDADFWLHRKEVA